MLKVRGSPGSSGGGGGKVSARLTKCGLNVLQALFGLIQQVVGNGHRVVIEAGGAGYENPFPIDHRARIADILLEFGS